MRISALITLLMITFAGCRDKERGVLSNRPSFVPVGIGEGELGDGQFLPPNEIRIEINWSPEVAPQEELPHLNPYTVETEPKAAHPKAQSKAHSKAKVATKKYTIKKAVPACKT